MDYKQIIFHADRDLQRSAEHSFKLSLPPTQGLRWMQSGATTASPWHIENMSKYKCNFWKPHFFIHPNGGKKKKKTLSENPCLLLFALCRDKRWLPLLSSPSLLRHRPWLFSLSCHTISLERYQFCAGNSWIIDAGLEGGSDGGRRWGSRRERSGFYECSVEHL